MQTTSTSAAVDGTCSSFMERKLNEWSDCVGGYALLKKKKKKGDSGCGERNPCPLSQGEEGIRERRCSSWNMFQSRTYPLKTNIYRDQMPGKKKKKTHITHVHAHKLHCQICAASSAYAVHCTGVDRQVRSFNAGDTKHDSSALKILPVSQFSIPSLQFHFNDLKKQQAPFHTETHKNCPLNVGCFLQRFC